MKAPFRVGVTINGEPLTIGDHIWPERELTQPGNFVTIRVDEDGELVFESARGGS